jgi:hypothetical protein
MGTSELRSHPAGEGENVRENVSKDSVAWGSMKSLKRGEECLCLEPGGFLVGRGLRGSALSCGALSTQDPQEARCKKPKQVSRETGTTFYSF